ncbi:hypothetical protein BSYN_12910 [Bacteroides sedimenti]|uniref:DUF3943 domain-containing protein n=2 Tax=Bacteroides sedimenti TaxID=2136147 RepID=A0ABN6Z9K5_9BACE
MAVFLLILSLGLLNAQNKTESPDTLSRWSAPTSDSFRFSKTSGNRSADDSLYAFNDSLRMKKYPWRAIAQNIGLNIAVWGFNHFAMKEGFAKISFRSISQNISHGFYWDNDGFATNLLAHPYSGGIYFNTARSNGISFWNSAIYSFGGSFIWEMIGENQPPSTNDLLSTTVGGIAMGEITHRVSSVILDDSQRGFERFIRELAGMVISPVRGFNWVITGDAWKVRNKYFKYHDFNKIPVKYSATLGYRFIADEHRFNKSSYLPYVEFNLIYGDPWKENNKPYDYFNLNVVLNMDGSQPVFGSVNLAAKLYGQLLEPKEGHKILLGLFQHYDYYDSKYLTRNSVNAPYKISETVALGIGALYQFPSVGNISIRQHSYLNAILLGGCLTDYYRIDQRTYNLGSGYSIKSKTNIDFGRYASFELILNDYHIFTSKGYNIETYKTIDPYFLNSQGDKGEAHFTLINPSVEFNLSSKLALNMALFYYLRYMNYIYYRNSFNYAFETRLGLRYNF